MDTERVPPLLTWEWFRAWLAAHAPEVPPPEVPEQGCWKDAGALLRKYKLQDRVLNWLRNAPGERAQALLCAVHVGLIEIAPDELLALLKEAPGNRAWALYVAELHRFIDVSPAELLALLKEAPGDRDTALRWAALDGLIPRAGEAP